MNLQGIHSSTFISCSNYHRQPYPLHHAIQKGDTEEASKLLKTNIDVNGVDEDGNTPLVYAIQKHDLLMIALLIDHGANLNSTCKDKNPLLIHCLKKNLCDFETFKYLINQGANVDAVDSAGDHILFYSLKYKTDDFALLLLEHNANPHAVNQDKTPVLALALFSKHVLVVEELLKKGVDPNTLYPTFDSTTLFVMLSKKQDQLKLLLLSGFDPYKTSSKKPFTHCVTGWNFLKICLELGCIVPIEERAAILTAASKNLDDPTALFIHVNQSITKYDVLNDISPLHYAILQKDYLLIKALLNIGADPNHSSPRLGSPLHTARILQLPDEYIRMLIQYGAQDLDEIPLIKQKIPQNNEVITRKWILECEYMLSPEVVNNLLIELINNQDPPLIKHIFQRCVAPQDLSKIESGTFLLHALRKCKSILQGNVGKKTIEKITSLRIVRLLIKNSTDITFNGEYKFVLFDIIQLSFSIQSSLCIQDGEGFMRYQDCLHHIEHLFKNKHSPNEKCSNGVPVFFYCMNPALEYYQKHMQSKPISKDLIEHCWHYKQLFLRGVAIIRKFVFHGLDPYITDNNGKTIFDIMKELGPIPLLPILKHALKCEEEEALSKQIQKLDLNKN